MDFTEYKDYLGPRRACNFCGSTILEPWGTRGIFHLERCSQCGLVFINPRLNKEGLNRFYADYFNNRTADREMTLKREMMYQLEASFLLDHLQGDVSLLDVGCGGGHFLNVFPRHCVKIGTEIDPVAADYTKQQYGFKCYVGNFPDFQIREAPFDTLIFRGVIEHFTNPRRVLEMAGAFLKPGGLLYITSTPNLDSICAEIYRGKWNLVGPDHLFYFNETLLSDQLGKTGFRLIASQYLYAETPYANLKADFLQIQKARRGRGRGLAPTRISPPFWGNMLTLLYRKSK